MKIEVCIHIFNYINFKTHCFQWSCIHNIEERLSSDESDDSDNEDSDSEGYKTFNWSGSSTSISTTPSYIIQHAHIQVLLFLPLF